MNRFLCYFLLCFLGSTIAAAQSPVGGASQALPPLFGSTVLHTGTELVIVDVVAEDKDGRPVHGLKQEDFILTEDKTPQTILNFDEHTANQPVVQAPQLPPQPPGVFTDYNPVPSNGVLNVLLLDTLNTPTKDQSYVRYELQQYVKKANPGTRIAIFGLTNHLYFLQGFTSDPTVLKDVVDHGLIPRASSLLDDPTGGNSDSTSAAASAIGAGMQPGQIRSNLQNFEAEQEAFKARLRMEYTLGAFNQLGHYLAAFPGRKNLIWFSGAFPLDIVPDLSLQDPFAVMGGDMEAEYRETTNLLTHAQIAVYPVDARGLMTDPSLDAARSGIGYAKHPEAFAKEMSNFGDSQAQEHQTMQAIADDTGGHAFFNTNDLATAVTKAIDSGSNFYTLTYSPSHHSADGEYRTIKVHLSNEAAAKGIKLSYRQGYFADGPGNGSKGTVTLSSDDATSANNAAEAYAASVMSRGAPMPSNILFRVRVLPASKSTEDTLAPDNKPDPKGSFKGPYRRFDVDISAIGDGFSMTLQPDGHRTDKIEFTTFVYDPDGKLLNVDGRTISLNLTAQEYRKFLQSKIGFHLEVSAPAKSEAYLRIGIHNISSNTFGVVEIPTSAVSYLAPPIYPPVKK